MKNLVFAAVLVATSQVAGAGDIMRWVDADGILQYGDVPPAGVVADKVVIGFGQVRMDSTLSAEERFMREYTANPAAAGPGTDEQRMAVTEDPLNGKQIAPGWAKGW